MNTINLDPLKIKTSNLVLVLLVLVGLLIVKSYLDGNTSLNKDVLKEKVLDVVETRTAGNWDQYVEIDQINEEESAAKGYWSAWDKWKWIAYLDENESWTVLISMDGFKCDQVDDIPAKYNVFFRDALYLDKSTKYCY